MTDDEHDEAFEQGTGRPEPPVEEGRQNGEEGRQNGEQTSEHRARLIERAMLVQLGAGLTVGDDIIATLRDLSHQRPSSQGLERRLRDLSHRRPSSQGLERRLRDLSHRRPSSQGLERRLHRYEQRGRRVEERAIAFGKRITKV